MGKDNLSYFTWLVSMVHNTFMYFWPISLALVAFTILGIILWLRHEPKARFSKLAVMGCLCYAVAILLYGTLYAAGPNGETKPHSTIAPYIVYGLVFAQLATSVSIVIFAKAGQRVLLSATLLWELAVSLSAGFIALMSVSGVWL